MRRTLLASALLAAALLPAVADARPAARAAVVGGRTASLAEWPFAAALVASGQPSARGQFCGATVVASDAVVTAAHCVQDVPRFDVVVGRDRLGDEDRGQRLEVVDVTTHPRWSVARGTFDVAVVRVAAPIAAPAATAVLAAGETVLRTGDQVRVAGWGLVRERPDTSPERLREADLTVRSDAACRRSFGGLYRASVQLCAGTRGGGPPDACRGDSGGPLVRAGRLVGIVSFGGAECGSQTPTVYTRVQAVGRWIAETAAEPITAPAPEPAGGRTRARVADVACDGGRLCRVDARILGPASRVAGIVVRVQRSSRGCIRRRRCRRIDRLHLARPVARGVYRAFMNLPLGLLRIAVYGVDENGDRVGTPSGIAVTVVAG